MVDDNPVLERGHPADPEIHGGTCKIPFWGKPHINFDDDTDYTSDDYEDKFNKINQVIEEELGLTENEMPFDVSSLFNMKQTKNDMIKYLNQPFSDKDIIIIKDDRGYLDGEIPHFLEIHKKQGNPFIPLKQVLYEMATNEHYIHIQDNHRFLECFDKKNDYQYELFFGS